MTTTELMYAPSTIRRHRREWIKSLRSGKFRQTTGTLKKYDRKAKKIKHCCLGVASDICGIASERQAEQEEFYFYDLRGDDSYDFCEEAGLPQAAQEWLGLCTDYPSINFPEGVKGHEDPGMTALNDNGWSFRKIADALEKYGFSPEDDLLV